MEKKGIIYKWTCKITGLSYIGQTINEKERYYVHYKCLGNYNGVNKFHKALNDFPDIKMWDYSIIEDNIERIKLNEREIYWIEYYNSFYNGYNSTTGGIQKVHCVKHSEETKQKMSKTRKGLKHTKEHSMKIGLKHKGKILSDEVRDKIRNTLKGNKLSNETKKKISESCKGINKGRHKIWLDENDHTKGYRMVKVN